MNARPYPAPAQATLSIQGLSAAFDTANDSGLFIDGAQNNLATLIDKMKMEGYAIGDPIKDTTTHRPGWTAWRLPVASPKVSCDLLFFIPEDVS